MTTAETAPPALYAAAADIGIAEPDVHVSGIVADLVAVLVAVTAGEPRVLTLQDARALPSGPFELTHRSLQSGLRAWVERQANHPLGYVEQLYTFADRDRGLAPDQRVISISYLGLTREQQPRGTGEATGWQDWYNYLPWEDRRVGVPPMIDTVILPALRAFAKSAASAAVRQDRANRIAVTFGTDGRPWNEELVLQRYELLFEAGLIPEARRGTPGCRGGAGAGPQHDPRSSPDSRDGNCPAASQDQIPSGRVRADAGYVHAAAITALRRGARRAAGSQTEFPPPRRAAGTR